ncbi:MAG TPA: SLBB domain-containing protein [Candidatus Acidoferrum sp.]|nr:SLBB domain-containing protein [Candidatus Acidoferrum sp.]
MRNFNKSKNILSVVGLALWFCAPASAQQQTDAQRKISAQGRNEYGVEQSPDLSKENLDRVAASATQIRGVLAWNEGLMVELKRWVAKEATDNGQVVVDSSLTDQSIFERLERDVAFRSVATRLLQRYGYLTPTPNPDSDYAKEKQLVLQERARRLVQIESQEDTDSLKPQRSDRDLERTETCDPRRDEDCTQRTPPGRQNTRTPNEMSSPGTNPQVVPEQLPAQSPSRILRADGLPQDVDPLNGSSGDNLSSTFQLTSGSVKRETNPLVGSQSLGQGAIDNLPSGQNLPSMPIDRRSTTDLVPNNRGLQPTSGPRTPWARTNEEDLTPVRMVHRPNPYSDIPSLFDMYVQASSRQRPAERFGLDIFRNTSNDPQAIPMDLPVGPDYVLGPGDSLEIDLWGGVSQRMFRVVDRAGRVSLPEAGPLLVSGRNLGDVQEAVQHALRTQYRDVSADVSLSKLRTVRVYVVGDVAEPGAYDISSLSTPLNALFVAGGVTPRGSLRALKHYRGKQLVEEVDAYDLLLHGVRSDMRRLENGDTLLVPSIGPQVTVDGMVRRPAIYELHGESSLADVLDLAGGILPTATLRHIEVQRVEAHQKRTMLALDLSPTEDADSAKKKLDAFKVNDGDEIHIFPIAPYNEDAIYLQGHVLRPGRYSYKHGMSLSDLIGSYKDLLPEPAPHYAEIVRLNPPDFHPSVESFDLTAALANPASAPKLQPLDTVRLFSRYDFEPAPEVWIGGEVREPGKYRTSGQAHLRDAVYLAGGVTQDASLDTAQLFRTQPDGTMKILSVDLREALAGNPLDNILIQPRDRLLVHRNPARVDPPTVYINGEVAKPGRYPLTANMHLEDLVHVAGGLKRSAYTESADLSRFDPNASRTNPSDRLEVNLTAAMGGDEKNDVPLRDGDILTIRQLPRWNDIGASMTVRGEVLHPGTYGLDPGERLSSVLARSGGFGSEAYPYGAVLVRKEVREFEVKSHVELVLRVKAEQDYLKSLPETDTDQKNAKLRAIAQTQSTLDQLEAAAPVGRVVIHVRSDLRSWRNTPADIPVRDGDLLIIPKSANYVTVTGQVFNPTAVANVPGHSAKWYLSQAGGVTQLADKKAIFVIRADGSVIAAKNNSGGWWGGDPMSATLRAGDTIVVPEKAPKIGGRNWAAIMQSAQLASSVALAVAYIHP